MAPAGKPFSRVVNTLPRYSYICRSCRIQIRGPICTTTRRGYSSGSDLPFTEKVRRKIWGTDNPPGLADPYGGPSFLEKRRIAREAAQRQLSTVQEAERDDVYTEQAGNEHIYEQQLDRQPAQYVEARTWDGLEHVGHLGDWRDLPPEPQDQYYSWFNSTSKVAINRSELLSCLHQSIVECLACRDAAIDPATVLLFNPIEMDNAVYAAARIIPSEGGLQLQFTSQVEKEHLTNLLSAVDQVATDPIVQDTVSEPNLDQDQATMHKEHVQSTDSDDHQLDNDIVESEVGTSAMQEIQVSHYNITDDAFLSFKLDLRDPLVFIILKRFAQLSGQKVPDHLLNQTISGNHNLQYLLDGMYDAIKPKPKNIATALMQTQSLARQGNVWVMPRRETPVDKEKEIGRWKIIEKELQDRGLPVLGKLQS